MKPRALRGIKTNYPFRRLTSRYDEVNRQIYRIESEEEPTTDEVLERLKKERLKLKRAWLRKALLQDGHGDQHHR